MIAFQLDTAGIFQKGAVANPWDPWDPDAEYPAGKLQLEDYDHSDTLGSLELIRKITPVWQVVIAWRSVAGVMDLAPHRHNFDLQIN